MKYIIDVLKPLIVNAFHEAMHRQETSSHSIQLQANPTNPAPFGYVSSSIAAQVTSVIVEHILSPPPQIRILQRAETIGMPNPIQMNQISHNNGNLANQNAQQNMPLLNVENVQPAALVPLGDNVRPVGMVPQQNIAPIPYRRNVVIDNQSR